MIKLIFVCVISSVVSIGVYERYVLGLDRSEQNEESAAVLDAIAERVYQHKDSIPFASNKEELKDFLDSAGDQTKMFFHSFKDQKFTNSQRPYR